MINLLHCDCMDFMRGLPDKAYSLCICDPPYGVDMANRASSMKWGAGRLASKDWDKETPPQEYFDEIRRVSVNQIVFGGNYFAQMWPTRCFVVWDKGAGFRDRCFAEAEIACTSFDRNAKVFSYDPLAHGDYRGKIHICQKPVLLYKFLLKNFASTGDRILDTHGGSCSLAIACHDMGFDLDACEIDADYYRDAVARYERHAAQAQLFNGDLGYTYTNGTENAQQAELPIEGTNK